MTTEARNEAADYLRLGMPKPLHAKLDEALTAERRATVERIRERLPRFVETRYGYTPEKVLAVYREDLDAILDEEAVR